MRQSEAYAAKEVAVYEAVLALIAQGNAIEKLTVQQIAQCAGIGKGTVYEYFTAREEIFKKTILYRMKQETAQLETALHTSETFEEKFDALLRQMGQAVHSSISSAQILLSNLQNTELRTLLGKEGALCDLFACRLRALLVEVLECGVREGVLAPLPSPEYGLLALSGVLLSFCNALHLSANMAQEMNVQALSRAEYVLLCKALS